MENSAVCSLFFVVDTSGSNVGCRIAKINKALDEGINLLTKYVSENSNLLIKIGILQFSTKCCWINPLGPEDVRECTFNGFVAGGVTNLGTALVELADKLSRRKFLDSSERQMRPTIIIITDGYSNDDWRKALNILNSNKWFSISIKLAFAIGDNVDISMLSSIVGTEEGVIHIETEDNLENDLLFWLSALFKKSRIVTGTVYE